jgi:hypothetical protein
MRKMMVKCQISEGEEQSESEESPSQVRALLDPLGLGMDLEGNS